MTADPRRYTYEYRKARERLKRQTRRNNWTCWLCHKPFDWTLNPSDRMAWTADHVTPLGRGGDILGVMKPAHRSCNSARGDGSKEARLPTSRKWL